MTRFADGEADTPVDWTPVSGAGLAAYGAAAAVALVFLYGDDGWVPLLDSANLAFHEAGHPLTGLFSARLAVYGGTLGQLAFPVAAMVSFHRRRAALSFAFASLWLCENLFNIARYMADARTQSLPLVGGGEHDWTEIFSRWGLLESDGAVAGLLRLVAWGGILATAWWLARRRA